MITWTFDLSGDVADHHEANDRSVNVMARSPRVIGQTVWLVALTWAGLHPSITGAADAPPRGVGTPAYGDFLVIPLHVHVLRATDLAEIDCALTDADIDRIVGKVNAIWHPAGIHWGLQPLIREPAARQGEFRTRRDSVRDTGPIPLGLYRSLVPESSRTKTGLHVYFIHQFGVNGVYLGDATAFVQETAKLRPVEGGIDEPLPRVTAHELGHALGLPHRQDRTNLLASGTTGTSLNAAESDHAREFALKTPGTRTVAELTRAAEDSTKSGRFAEARRFWSDLAAIPGEGAAEAARRRDALSTEVRRN